MRNAIIIHGSCDREEYYSQRYPSASNSHWIPWLQNQLLINNISTQTPEIPSSYKAIWKIWKEVIERFPIDKKTLLIGHSTGGGFLLRWLSENKVQINKLILVAPFLDPAKTKKNKFYDFEIGKDIQERTKEVHVSISEDEHIEGVPESVDIIKNTLPKAVVHKFKDKGHFTYDDMGTDKFPELLEIILE